MDQTKKRHLLKTISWRIIATSTTLLLTFLVSGDIEIGATVASLEFFAKMILYYLHERGWHKTSLGVTPKENP